MAAIEVADDITCTRNGWVFVFEGFIPQYCERWSSGGKILLCSGNGFSVVQWDVVITVAGIYGKNICFLLLRSLHYDYIYQIFQIYDYIYTRLYIEV